MSDQETVLWIAVNHGDIRVELQRQCETLELPYRQMTLHSSQLLQHISANKHVALVAALVEQSEVDDLRQVMGQFTHLPCLLIVSPGLYPQAAELLSNGVGDVIAWPTPEKFLFQKLRLFAAEHMQRHGGVSSEHSEFIAHSAAMRHARLAGQQLAQGLAPVIISGESGVGKHALAAYMHQCSPQGGLTHRAMVVFDAMEPGDALHHYAPAPSLEEARHGVAVLSHIDRWEAAQRASLQQAAAAAESLHIQWIATATEITPELRGWLRELAGGKNGEVAIHLPPLRQRVEDIPALAEYFLSKMRAQDANLPISCNGEALRMLQRLPWTGNAHELKRCLQRAAILAHQSVITPYEIVLALAHTQHNPQSATGRSGTQMPETDRTGSGQAVINLFNRNGQLKRMEEVETEILQFALLYCQGRMSDTARRLGIGRSTLYRKLQEHELHRSVSA